jgi:capsid protein
MSEVKLYDPRTWPIFARKQETSLQEMMYRKHMRDLEAMSHMRNVINTPVPFTGSVNQDLAGPAIEYNQEHYELAVRSWQQLHESDLAQIAIKRLITWTIGKGLKIQSEPDDEILKEEGIRNFDKNKFSKSVERRFALWKKSKNVHWGGTMTFDELSAEAETNGIVAGDILVILRVVHGEIKIQHIDGRHVQSPLYGSEWFPNNLPNGHLIIDGVEINDKREHIAYWVKVYALEANMKNFNQPYRFERIEAKNPETGYTMAYLYYGRRYQINSVRGWPLVGAMIEKLTSTSQYSTATLQQAKASAKVDYQSVTKENAVGGGPWTNAAVSGINGRAFDQNNSLGETEDGVSKGSRSIATSLGTVYENPPGTEVKVLENKNPLYFKDFYTVHAEVFFAVCEIPPNVAMSKYDQSFSASRMATGDWQNTLVVKRDAHHTGYIKPIFDLWLDLEILKNKVPASGYVLVRSKNTTAVECYRKCRFVGANVPAVDSVKEATAARMLLGEAGKHLPLNDLENITELIGGGDANENLEQFAKELQMAEKLKIVPLPVVQQVKEKGSNEENAQD